MNGEGEREFILGNCVQNARILAEYINSNSSYNATVVRGGLKLRDEPIPGSYSEAKRDGTLHHWVVVDTPEGQFHADVAEERYAVTDGQPFVARSPPQNYICF
jgi:hypothetical protein